MQPIEERIKALEKMTLDGLHAEWRQLLPDQPAPRQKEGLLWRMTHHLQEKAYGGLKAGTIAKLNRIAYQGQSTLQPKYLPMPGTRLMREWNGVAYYVTVLEDGFEYAGRRYSSLSAISGEITGTTYSGPRFFKLKTYHDA